MCMGTKRTVRKVEMIVQDSSLRRKRFVWFRSKERPRKRILGFGRTRNETSAILTLVPRSLLLNRTETLATQVNTFGRELVCVAFYAC